MAMDNNSKREAIEKFNIKGRLFNMLILEENGKFVLHLGGKEGSVYKKESLPKFVPDFVDEVVYEQNWKLFLKSRKMTKEEFEKITYCIDKTKGAPIMFHGTSTFYLDLIKRNGFNKRNFYEEYGWKEMLLELEQACIESGILLESYWESGDDIDQTHTNNCYHIQNKWNNDERIVGVNSILYRNIRHIKKEVKNYQYGPLYFTTSLFRIKLYAMKQYTVKGETVVRGSLGELFNEIMRVYIMYRQITGKMYLFQKPEHNELIKKVYDTENNCVAEWIQPVLIAVKDLPWEDLTNEAREGKVSLYGMSREGVRSQNPDVYRVHKEDYIQAQLSARYVGGDIPPEKLEIIEFKDDKELKQKVYERFEISEKSLL